jgi:hypothetical protein
MYGQNQANQATSRTVGNWTVVLSLTITLQVNLHLGLSVSTR